MLPFRLKLGVSKYIFLNLSCIDHIAIPFWEERRNTRFSFRKDKEEKSMQVKERTFRLRLAYKEVRPRKTTHSSNHSVHTSWMRELIPEQDHLAEIPL